MPRPSAEVHPPGEGGTARRNDGFHRARRLTRSGFAKRLGTIIVDRYTSKTSLGCELNLDGPQLTVQMNPNVTWPACRDTSSRSAAPGERGTTKTHIVGRFDFADFDMSKWTYSPEHNGTFVSRRRHRAYVDAGVPVGAVLTFELLRNDGDKRSVDVTIR